MNVLKLLFFINLVLLVGCGGSGGDSLEAIAPIVEPPAENIRSAASYDYLISNNDETFTTSAFTPNNANQASNIFEGQLTISGTAIFKQNYGTADSLPEGYLKWPEFSYEFIQDEGRLIPVDRGHGFIGNGSWSITAGVGAVWDESDDNGFSRAAFPYTIKQNNSNCEANGLATFLFKSDGEITNVHVQNVAETCVFYGFEFYGTLTGTYANYNIVDKIQVISERNIEEMARIPTKPLSELVIDFPNVDLGNYGYAIDEADLNGYSILVNNTNYIAGCGTRYGEHPFCSEKTIGVYSFTKSMHGFLIVAAMEKRYPGFKNLLIKDLVPECAGSLWDGVTIEHTLNMATGNYQSAGFEVDENSNAMAINYFSQTSRSQRAEFACNAWTQQVAPGSYSVYHTTDTELLGYATAKYANTMLANSGFGNDAEAFNDILIPIYDAIGLSHYLRGIQRTSDTKDAWGGYGLSATLNDVVRFSQYLRDEGVSGGLLDPTMVTQVLSGEPQGLPANLAYFNYDQGFWRYHVGVVSNMSTCGADTQAPMLSGFGGHTSLILPEVIITQLTDSGNLGIQRTINDVFANISNVCP